jgi:DNA invertase Pin-like site-specific DNA recombinase
MTNTIRAYLRASTQEQDATRAKQQLTDFALSQGRSEPRWYVENESGATLKRPALMRLLEESHNGDVLLLEQVDRLSRLNAADWEALKVMIQAKGVVVVSIDLPTSYQLMADPSKVAPDSAEAFNQRSLKAINGMLLDMLGAIARKDYDDRRRRQAQGIEKAQTEGKFKGRQPDLERHERIRKLLTAGLSYTDIQDSLEGVSRATIAKVAKTLTQAV